MTQNSFLRLIRMYAQLSAIKRRSYADAVVEIVRQREAAIAVDLPDTDERGAAIASTREIVDREYGRADNLWVDAESRLT